MMPNQMGHPLNLYQHSLLLKYLKQHPRSSKCRRVVYHHSPHRRVVLHHRLLKLQRLNHNNNNHNNNSKHLLYHCHLQHKCTTPLQA